jgi:ribosomal-protein-alanine N-acetyltransferase
MNFEHLETNRLFLTGISDPAMKHIFDTLPKPKIMELLGHRNNEEYLKEREKHLNGYASYNRSFMLFLLKDKDTNTIIGRCGLHNWNKDHRRAEIGYVMEDEVFRGKGLMTEAVAAILQYGFTTLRLNRIEALVGAENAASLRIIEKHHFKQEGILKEHLQTESGVEDSLLFALLQSEFLLKQV